MDVGVFCVMDKNCGNTGSYGRREVEDIIRLDAYGQVCSDERPAAGAGHRIGSVGGCTVRYGGIAQHWEADKQSTADDPPDCTGSAGTIGGRGSVLVDQVSGQIDVLLEEPRIELLLPDEVVRWVTHS